MPYNPETEQFFQAPATIVDSTPDGDTVQEGFDDRLTPAMAGVYTDLNLLKENGMIGVGIPATTTSRGIGRVATLADMEPGAVVENGPAVIDAKGGVITTTPTAHAVPQADEDGKLDGWVSPDANKANTSLDNITTAAETVIRNLTKINNVSSRTSTGEWTITGLTIDKPLYILMSHDTTTLSGNLARLSVLSGSLDGVTTETYKYELGSVPGSYASTNCFVCVPTSETVIVSVATLSGDVATLRAYQ